MPPKKSVRKLFKIGEVAEYSGLSRQTVNYYSVLGILPETGRTRAGHRLYDESVFDRIERTRQLKATKTLREIADILRHEPPHAPRQEGSDAETT